MRVRLDIYSIRQLFILLNYMSTSFVEVCIFHDNTHLQYKKFRYKRSVFFKAFIAIQFAKVWCLVLTANLLC